MELPESPVGGKNYEQEPSVRELLERVQELEKKVKAQGQMIVMLKSRIIKERGHEYTQ